MKNNIESSFSKSANTYDENSDVQKQIADHLVSLIDEKINPNTIIDLGTGTGYLASKLQQRYHNSDLDLCDISKEMLQVSSTKIKYRELICGNFEDLKLSKKYDLIASSAALHWTDSFSSVASELSKISDSMIAISIMLEGTLHELRDIRKVIAPNKEARPILYNLEYFERIINLYFNIIYSEIKSYTLYFDTPELALESLRKTGVNGGSSERLSKEEYQKLIQIYSSRYKTDLGYPLSYKAGFIISSIKEQD